jgi:hypothetical protein
MGDKMEELKKVVKFGIELGEAIEASLEDGKLGLEDFAILIKPLMGAPAALAGAKAAVEQIKNLDSAKVAELHQFIEVELDLKNDKVEAVIEKSVKAVEMIFDLVELFKKPAQA